MKRSILIALFLFVSASLLASVPNVRRLFIGFAMKPQAQTASTHRQNTSRRSAEPLENFDIRANLNRTLIAPPQDFPVKNNATTESENAAQELLTEHPRTIIRWSSLTGTPSRLLNLNESLSEASQDDAENIGRRFLKDQKSLFQLRNEEIDNLKIERRDRSTHNGVTHLTYEQRVGDIEVFQGQFKIHVDRKGTVIAASGELIPEANSRINRDAPRLSNLEALRLASQFAGVNATIRPTISDPTQTESQNAERATHFGAIPDVASEANARLVYFPLSSKSLRLAWEYTLWMQGSPDVYLIVVDAERGSLLYRYNCTNYENPRGLVFTGDSPRPDVPRANDNPPIVDRQEVPFNGAPYFPTTDKHFDWWNGASQTTLISNNTDTHLDRSPANNIPDEPRLTVTDSKFSFPIDFNQPPTTEDNQKSAQANVFYWVNRYHDILYSFGFTETAGNFQTDNFGLGGVGNDAIQADVQDGSGTNNANFSTPPDGRAGRMQMYLWNSGAPQQLDGDFDQGIIIHELTHGLSSRLVGNGGGLGSMQSGGMGEGWSDFLGLTLLRKEGDDLDGEYAVGQYASNNPRGIRRYPYSTNKTVNPLTFANISLTTQVHRVGEIWCLTLWEMRAALIRRHGFAEGQRQSIQLVVDGLKLSPGNPTFIEARDAILLADRTNNGGANQCLLWQAFAKRGLGYSASTLNGDDAAPKEAFDTPPNCNDAGTLTLDRTHYLIGESIRVSVADRNASKPNKVTLTSSITGDQETLMLPQEAQIPGSYKAQIQLATGKATSGDGMLQASVEAGDQISVSYDDQNTGSGATAQIKATVVVAREKTLFLDNVESGNQGWFPSGNWAMVSNKSASPRYSWTDSPGTNYASSSDTALTSQSFDFTNLSDITLHFSQSYVTETGFDYGLVEYSTDDGATWQRVAAYSGNVSNFTQAVVNLNALSNQSRARIRFRLLIDPLDNYDGWYVDDIRITGRSANRNIVKPTDQGAPNILALSPAFGSLSGGTTVTITGTNFTETTDTSIAFDGIPARSINVISNTMLTAVTPPHAAGAVVVSIRNKYGEGSISNGFTYFQSSNSTEPARINHIFPTSGSTRGGLPLTLSGSNFTPETKVSIGGQNSVVTYVNPSTLRVLTPPTGTIGAVDVVTSNGSTNFTMAQAFTYLAPTPPSVQVLTPTSGQVTAVGGVLGITWNSSDNRSIKSHRVSLLRDTAFVTDLATELPGDTQSFNWRVPTNQEQLSNYRIRVVAIDDENAESEAISETFRLGRNWESQNPMPLSGLMRILPVSDGRYLYAIGGRTAAASTTATNLLQRFDPNNNGWFSLTTLPVMLSSGEAVHVNGKLYVPGGQTESSAIATTYIYDIASNAWTTGANAPIPASAHSIGTDTTQNIIYVTGGLNSTSTGIANVRAYDVNSNSWSTLPAMKSARFSHEAAFIDGKLYVAGGFGTAGGLSTCEVYSPANQQWTDIAPLNRARAYAASTIFKDDSGNSYWLLVGGEDPALGVLLNSAEVYDVRNNRWILLDSSFNLPTARTQTNGAQVGEYFYMVGGGVGSTSQPSVIPTLERIRLPIRLTSSGTPPILSVPASQIGIPNTELKFAVSASDLNSISPLSITAEELPAGASFVNDVSTANRARGLFRWTPNNSDVGRSFTVRFKVSDGNLSETRIVSVKVVNASGLGVTNAANYRVGALPSDSIASVFGENLALRTESATALPLPTELAGTSVTVNGIPASLLYVSPTQVNFITPANLDAGEATVIVSNPNGSYSMGATQITAVAPSIFTADATGRGDAAAFTTTDGINYIPPPFDVMVNGRPNILVLFGTGIRNASAQDSSDANGVAESMRITIGGQEAKVLYAGAQGQYIGLDQINVEIPNNLTGGGRRVEVVVTLNGIEANRVSIVLK